MLRSRSLPWLLACGALLTQAADAQPSQKVTLGRVLDQELPATIRLVANLRPDRTSVIASEFAGLVAGLTVDDGQRVAAGEILCQLDNHASQFRLREAQASLASLQAELAERENGTRREVLDQLTAAVGESQALFDMWAFEKKRIAELFDIAQANPKEKNDADMEYLAAERRLSQARARLEAARNGPRTEEIERFRHAVAAQQAVVLRLQREVENGHIRAPFDGFVTARHTEVGQWLPAGGPVVELVAIDRIRVRCEVPEDAIAFARTGAPASVEIAALNRTAAGTIARIIPRALENARTFPVEIDLPNPDLDLLPGMFAWAHVPAGPAGTRLLVEKDAVVPRGDQKHVFLVRPDGNGGYLAMPLAVETGLEHEGRIEVRGPGLQAGAIVVIRANERLLPFMPNQVLPLNPELFEQAASPRQE